MLDTILLHNVLNRIHGEVHRLPEKLFELFAEWMLLVQRVFPESSPLNLLHFEPAREVFWSWIYKFGYHAEVTELQGDHEQILVSFIVAWVERATRLNDGIDFEETTTLLRGPIFQYLDHCVFVICRFVNFGEFPVAEAFAQFWLTIC